MMTEELQVSAKNEPLFGLRAEPKMKTEKTMRTVTTVTIVVGITDDLSMTLAGLVG